MTVTPDPAPTAPSWADVLALVAKLDASGLEDAEIVMEGVSVRVSKSVLGSTTARGGQAPVEPPAIAAPAPAPAAARPDPEPAPARADVVDGPAVTAPMLGVLYLRPAPDAAPFVEVGDTVAADTTVAIIEVMKMMNPVTAGLPGKVVEVCALEGTMVEHGEVLIRLQAG